MSETELILLLSSTQKVYKGWIFGFAKEDIVSQFLKIK